MAITVSLHYADGSGEGLRLPAEITVDALPPIGTRISLTGDHYTVDSLFLDVRGNGDSTWTLTLTLAPFAD